MNFDDFFRSIESKNISITLKNTDAKQRTLENEALFQLPLISLIILIMAKDRRKPLIAEVGQLVGECIEASMIGFKGSAQHIGWSANLRVRTVTALSFLEHAKLVEMQNRKGKVKLTELGKKVINHALELENNLSYNLSQISRSYRNICVSKQLDMEIE
jgi:predicted transcriptional regulator